MKLSFVISSILLLGVAMSAIPQNAQLRPKTVNGLIKKAKEQGIQLKDHSPFSKSLYAKRDDTCVAITCVEQGNACTEGSSYCKSDTNCIGGVCRTSIAGDACDDENECTGDFACDDSTSKCIAKPTLGESCSPYVGCSTGLECTDSKCVAGPSKVGDACESSFFGDNCPDGMKCSDDDVCVLYPSTVGATCDSGVGCGNNLYCDSETSTCKEYPAAGESCVDDMCLGGLFSTLYCDSSNVCREPKADGESCTDDNECEASSFCNDDNVCQKHVPGADCESSDDCETFQGCNNGVCVTQFTLDEGAECPSLYSGDDMDDIESAFLCKEGLSCVPDRNSGSRYVCKKSETKFSDNIQCSSDSDCPEDSYCNCSSVTGAMQCMPYLESSMKNYNTVYNYAQTLVSIFMGTATEDDLIAATMELYNMTDPTNPIVRCYSSEPYVPPPTPIAPASSSSSSKVIVPSSPKTSSEHSSEHKESQSDSTSFVGKMFVMPLMLLVTLLL